MKKILIATLIIMSSTLYAAEADQCTVPERWGFFNKIKNSLGNQINKIKRHNQNKKDRLKQMKENDKTSFVGRYHTVSSCGIYEFPDVFKGGSMIKKAVDKVHTAPGQDIANLNIKNREGTIAGEASCARQTMRHLNTINSTRFRKVDKGAGLFLMALSAKDWIDGYKHECNGKRGGTYNKEMRVYGYNDGWGGLTQGKRRFPGVGGFSVRRKENFIADRCAELRGNTMVQTTDGSVMCLGYSKNGKDEITIYVKPANQIWTQRLVMRTEAAFHKYGVPKCEAKARLENGLID